MANKIELIVRGLTLHADHVLLCQCVKRGYMYLPGGHVEFGEGASAALVREFEEETGLSIRVGPLVAVSEGTFLHAGETHHEVNLVFHVELLAVATGELPPVPSREKKIAFVWLPLSEVAARDIRPSTAKNLLRSRVDASTCRFDSDMQ